MQNISLPIEFSLIENSNSNLQKCELWIMRDGLNSNGSSFDLGGMDKAKESLKNIPILAYIKKRDDGEDDFDEHNMEYRLETDEEGNICVKEHYLEVPIGVIPETNNYKLEKVNGHHWVVVDGYIWKSYSNEGYEILKRDEEKSVSMEISVNRGEFSKQVYNILDYTYQGVTILGSDVSPGIRGAKVKMDFSVNDNTEFFNAVKELNKVLKEELESEVNYVESKKKIEDSEDTIIEDTTIVENPENVVEEEVETPIVEETPEEEVTPTVEETVEDAIEEESDEVDEQTTEDADVEGAEEVEDVTSEEFSSNINNVVGYINEALSKITYEEEFLGEYFTSPKYYFEDLILDSSIAVLYDVESGKYIGANYSLEGDNVSINFDSTKEYIPTWKEREVGNNGEYGIVSAFKKNTEEKFASMFEEIKLENEKLRQFKDEIETELLKEELKSMTEEFSSLTEDETTEIIEKVINKQLNKEDFKKELFALVGMKMMGNENKENFNSKGTKLKVQIGQVDTDPYGGLIKK
ncbi:MAG: hypothetical protein ACRDA3_13080 [Peptostreptococcaceae bacterium]